MGNFFQELRERGVFRTAGLYIALVWLFLQIADVLFPAFDIPDSAVRLVLFGAAGLFPVVLVFAWFFEITGEGLQREEEVREGRVERLAFWRYSHLIMVGMLLLALAISVFFNVQQVVEKEETPPDTVSILIADTRNTTGDPIFDGVLEQALGIGLESATFIASYPRHTAQTIAQRLGEGGLDEARSRLVALREGVSLVVVGEIASAEGGFELLARVIDAETGELVSDPHSAGADSKADVLQAVSTLSDEIRESLGDVNLGEQEDRETFTAASLEAVSYYTQAQVLAKSGKDEQAVPLYEKAIAEDPNFGRAYSGWALSEFNLGHIEESTALWEKTLALLDGMNERERYRTLGLYYSLVSENYSKAIENYELLVEKFPADSVGHNNLAVVYFFDMQFGKALAEGASVVEIYPSNALYRTNLALYAMYAGQFEQARADGALVLETNPDYYKAYLPQAIAALASGDVDTAADLYRQMAQISDRGDSLAQLGLADIALLRARYTEAETILRAGIDRDLELGDQRGAASKGVALATALAQTGDLATTRDILAGLEASDRLAIAVPVARLYVQLGDNAKALEIAARLGKNLQSTYRAAAELVAGNVHLEEGDYPAAVDAFSASLERLDSWIARFDRARAYARAGSFAEALADFTQCEQRLGEVSSLFLDDSPTFSYAAELYYWLGVTKYELGMVSEANQALQAFLALQEGADSERIVDARNRLQPQGG